MCHPSFSDPQKPGGTSPSQSIPAHLLVQVPDHPACAEALSRAQSLLQPSIFNHSFRVYLYALKGLLLAASDGIIGSPAVEKTILFVSCILHDIASAHTLASDPQRFEVTGADFAAALLARHDVQTSTIRESWLAIALHTSPHVAEGAGGIVRLLRLAVLADFGTVSDALRLLLSQEYVDQVEGLLPRLGVEKDLGDAVVSQARSSRTKAPGGSWPGDLLRAAEAEPGWQGVNKAF